MSRNYDLHMESLAIEAHARIGGEKDDGRNRTFTLQRGNLIVTILSTHVTGGPAPGPPTPEATDGSVPPVPPGETDTPAPRRRGGRRGDCMIDVIEFLRDRGQAHFTVIAEEFAEVYSDSTVARALNKIVAAGIAEHLGRTAPYRFLGDD